MTLIAGTVGGLAASALALQATGTWHPTETEAATVVAVAAATASVATIRSAVDRFRADFRWRRWRRLTIAIVIALASVAAAAILALVAGQFVRLDSTGRGIVIAVAAGCAFVGAIVDAYGDERLLGDQNRQKELEGATSLLLVDAHTTIKIGPRNLEVVLLLVTRKKFWPGHAALRVVHTDTIGGVYHHPGVIHQAKQDTDEIVKKIWECYRDEKDVTNIPKQDVLPIQTGKFQAVILTGPGVWASPVRNEARKVVGVLALRAYEAFESREHFSSDSLGFAVNLAASGVSNVIGTDY
ncbi:MAG TPA: hypothetical protein VH637_02405 [Streptosporangiaceae bacterium]